MAEIPPESLVAEWTATQHDIASRVKRTDDTDWGHQLHGEECSNPRPLFIAGADISFPTDPSIPYAVATIVVVKLTGTRSTELIFSKSTEVVMKHPYVPSFLAFREAPIVATLLSGLPEKVRQKIDCLLLDGNGTLHPRKAGLACHVGVLEDIPTVGVSKALLCVDGLDEKKVRTATAECNNPEGLDVIGESGFVWGKSMLTGNAVTKPIYVSVGNKVSLRSASRLVRSLCVYRVPEPIRFADLHSRAYLRNEPVEVNKVKEFL